MGKLFGTDGIRGVANCGLDATLAYKTGLAAAFVIAKSQHSERRAKIIIGKDTRISSDMIESALVAGICSAGADVELVGVIPTPAVAFLTVKHGADAGIVISASHNPFEHNGIKIFSSNGFKLSDALENEMENLIENPDQIPLMTHEKIGRIYHREEGALSDYVDHLSSIKNIDISGMKIAVDCANGASYRSADMMFSRFNAEYQIINAAPNGVNINSLCGSTSLSGLKKHVVDGGFDIGIAFDGDADRCLAVDEKGDTIDGDVIMALCAAKMQSEGRLPHESFVATMLSNLGLHAFAREKGISITTSNVGDRYVLEKMIEGGFALGGEQSGHVIFLEYATTGDGEITALQFLNALKASGKSASEFSSEVVQYPQMTINVKVPADKKAEIASRKEVKDAIEKAQRETLTEGRVLVRPSGTEALVRVMAEGKCIDDVEAAARDIASVIEEISKG